MKLQKELQRQITTIQAFDTKTGKQVIDGIIWDGSLEHLAGYINKAYNTLNHFEEWGDNLTLDWLKNNFHYDEYFVLDDIKYVFGEYIADFEYYYDEECAVLPGFNTLL